ncbi:MAG: biopolymer transporter ExbD [Planctomycetaceae bacterium]|jgi:biopolymer transport protein ExbD|nr:biopolymer transporter ExbD [Planctomycetaceae bacterium]
MKTVHLNRKKITLELRMTAMIDMIFLLLIFFICTSSFRPSESLMTTDMSLPGNITSDVKLQIPEPSDIDVAIIKITLGEVPQWYLAGKECKSIRQLGELLIELRDIQNDLPVVIDSDPNVPIKNVIDVYDACRAASLTKIQFAANNTKNREK